MLSTDAPDTGGEPDRYRYDPADPTPAMGGIGMLTGGARDNRPLEARRRRPRVHRAPSSTEPLELIGPVSAELYVTSSLDHIDFFVRVCDVHPDGTSLNVCDGLQRFDPPIDRHGMPTACSSHACAVWPTGHRFAAGHRVRVQVSSGSHPVYARNLGTGEPAETAVDMLASDQTVLHDAAHPSAVTLPHLAV